MEALFAQPLMKCSFDPAFLIEILDNLQALDEILEDVIESDAILSPQQLIEPEMTEAVTGRRLQPEMTETVTGRRLRDSTPSDAPDTSYQLPPVCIDECAPTHTSCLCQRLARCVNNMTHYELAVLFAGGYIQNDTSRWVWTHNCTSIVHLTDFISVLVSVSSSYGYVSWFLSKFCFAILI